MKKNVAGQIIGAQLNSKTDGSAVTSGTTTVYICGDGGAQTAVGGSPSCHHMGNGWWQYEPTQAETNYDHVAFTFVNTSAVIATIQVYPSYPQTGDNYARLGTPAGASIAADIAGVQSDTNDIQTRIPAALVSGRIDASVGAMAANTLTASALATDAVTEIQSGLSTLDAAGVRTAVGLASANLDTQLAAIDAVTDKVNTTLESVGSPGQFVFTAEALAQAPSGTGASATEIADEVQTRTIAAVTTVNGLAANSVTAAALATDAVTEIQSGLATAAALSTVAGYLDTEIAAILADTNELQTDWVNGGRLDLLIDAIKAKTDNLPVAPAATGDVTGAWTTAMVEAYAADGATMTPAQALYMIWSLLAERNLSGTTLTAKKLDGSTTSMTFTLDSATVPTTQTRTT